MAGVVVVVVACLGVSWECVCQHTHSLPLYEAATGPYHTHLLQPMTHSLSFPGPARGDWKREVGLQGQSQGLAGPVLSLGAGLGLWGPE